MREVNSHTCDAANSREATTSEHVVDQAPIDASDIAIGEQASIACDGQAVDGSTADVFYANLPLGDAPRGIVKGVCVAYGCTSPPMPDSRGSNKIVPLRRSTVGELGSYDCSVASGRKSVSEDGAAVAEVHSAPFGDKPDDPATNAKQVAGMVSALIDNQRDRQRAVLEAVVKCCGLDPSEVDCLLDGTSTRQLQAPPKVRALLAEMDLNHILAPVHLFEYGSCEVLVNEASWQDLEIEVALDSGSVCHVISEADTPCYALDDSPSARQCREFVVGDGGTMKNFGQKRLNLSCESANFSSVFQIAAVHRPLMSVGKICDNENVVTFDKSRATVTASDGTILCIFERQPGGLYTAKLRLTSPFGRQEK